MNCPTSATRIRSVPADPGVHPPFHEPTHPRPLPGGEHAFVRVLSVPLLGGVRGGFSVAMHGIKNPEATHEIRAAPDRRNRTTPQAHHEPLSGLPRGVPGGGVANRWPARKSLSQTHLP